MADKLLVRFKGSPNPVSEEERLRRVASIKGVVEVGLRMTSKRGGDYIITRIDDDGVWGVPYQGANNMDGHAIFRIIMEHMRYDNDYQYVVTKQQENAGAVLCENLRDAGYFNDDPNDLDGSFWQAAGGEDMEQLEFFRGHPAYIQLSKLLETIFNQEPK